MVRYLENESLDELVKDGIVLVDFYAEWCGPCKMLGPVLETLNENVIKVDVDKHNELAIKNGVMSVPTVFIYKNGEAKAKFIGLRSKEEIEEILKNIK